GRRLSWEGNMWRWVLLAGVLSCSGTKPGGGGQEGDADADTDSDADTDPGSGVDADGDGFTADVDCDDGDASVYPGAPDVCGDDRVTDCSRTSDDGLVTVDGTASFTDLQAALDAASDGSTVLVCPGTYTGAFVASVAVDLESHGDATTTILD